MSITTKHQCPSCGGCLSVDNDKQMYRCASCGSTYDFDYFREEKLLELGDTYLARGEFKAAVDVFKLILQNDPHDFQANRGMMLAAARMHSIDDIISNPSARMEITVCLSISTFMFLFLLFSIIELCKFIPLTASIKIPGINNIFCTNKDENKNNIPFPSS